MRARVVAGGIVTSAAVLVIGWQVGAQPGLTATQQQTSTSGGTSAGGTGSAGTGTAGTGSGSGGAGTSSGSGSAGTGSGTSGGASASGAAKDGTFTGHAAQTQYGPVQVEITVAGGKITDVTALELTDRDGRSAQISQQAAPILRQEALQAQSAQIQAVSGATYTSEGYVTSLQSAIDQAGL